MNGELPEGWADVRLEEVAESSLGKMLDKAKRTRGTSLPYLRNINVRWGEVDLADLAEMPFEPHELERFGLRAGDLLVCEGGEPGRCAVWRGSGAGIMFQKAIHRVRPSAALKVEFLRYHIEHQARTQALDELFTGTTIRHLTGASLSKLGVPLPPLNEQRRIVAKVEALMARSRRAKEALAAIPPLLDQLRQSILAAAFRGDLTADWRAQHPDVEPATVHAAAATRSTGRAATINVIEGRAALSVGDPQTALPRNWVRVLLSAVAQMESGHTPSRTHPEYWGGSTPWVSIPDARDHHGRVILETTSGITEAGLANSAARLLPKDTVCLCRTAASIGYATIFGQPMATSQDFVNWICSRALMPEYLLYALLAEGEHLRRFAKGSAHSTIYFPEAKAFHLVLPPVEEQRVIVAKVRDWLTRIGHLKLQHQALDEVASGLDSAILSKAFRGELVPQDPNDEPASVLLERIRAGKEHGAPKSSTGREAPGRARRRRG